MNSAENDRIGKKFKLVMKITYKKAFLKKQQQNGMRQ